jgi:DNA-directed RNA polymerase specialized sigma24 family protein
MEHDAFAVFYRRHARRLLDDLVRRTDDPPVAAAVCAETFALALERAQSFDPARGSAEAWLDGIAAALLERAGQRGEVSRRAQRRLGMAPLERGGDRERFVRDLEEELVAAARYRAAHPPRALPRPSRRAVLGGVTALALVAAVAGFALRGGDAAPGERAATPRAADTGLSPLLPMLPTVDCGGKGVRDEPASPVMPDIGLLQSERTSAPETPRRSPRTA